MEVWRSMLEALYKIDVISLVIYLILAVTPLITLKYLHGDKADNLWEIVTTLNIANFRKLIYRSTPTSLFKTIESRHPGYLLDIKKNILRGYRGRYIIDEAVPSEVRRVLKIVSDENTEVVDEATQIIMDNYRLILKEEMKQLETNLTILVTIYIFFPLLGMVLYSIMNNIIYSLTIIILQIIISETLLQRGMGWRKT